MKVIIFGGTGWVGSRIVKNFHDAGCETTICSRGQGGKRKVDGIENIPQINADKNNESEMTKIFRQKYDIVIDSVPTVESINNVFKLAKGLKHYIHCSSTGGYAPLPFIPGDETMPYQGFPGGGGWKQKAEVDTLLMNLFHTYGFPATVIRPSYISGQGMAPIDNLGGRRLDFVDDILANVTLDLPDAGLALLQPIHIDDLASVFLLAAKTHQSIGQVYNICLEKAVTLTQYLEISATALDRKVNINYIPLKDMLEKYGDSISDVGLKFMATHMCFDISKAKEQLNYQPRHSTEETIEENILWQKANSYKKQ